MQDFSVSDSVYKYPSLTKYALATPKHQNFLSYVQPCFPSLNISRVQISLTCFNKLQKWDDIYFPFVLCGPGAKLLGSIIYPSSSSDWDA
uniref:Uncharacterized protein n=1 Tax=Rhizophora mucronata TaxID=61149 RepID=A0A2P2JGW2_RHIMU